MLTYPAEELWLLSTKCWKNKIKTYPCHEILYEKVFADLCDAEKRCYCCRSCNLRRCKLREPTFPHLLSTYKHFVVLRFRSCVILRSSLPLCQRDQWSPYKTSSSLASDPYPLPSWISEPRKLQSGLPIHQRLQKVRKPLRNLLPLLLLPGFFSANLGTFADPPFEKVSDKNEK